MAKHLKEMNFEELYQCWKKDIRFCSDSTIINSHLAYLRIISKGWEALPFIFEKLNKETDHWYTALIAIVGENVVPSEDAGNMKKMREHWLKWARDNGFIE